MNSGYTRWVSRHSFLCDAMLGRLAKWLRLAGLDTGFDTALGDRDLAVIARTEGRWLLTADRELASRAGPRVILLAQGTLEALVAELRARLDLIIDPAGFLTRCSCCNGLVEPLAAEQARDLVPPFVAAHTNRFSRCQGCGRVYWAGSHGEAIRRRLRSLFLDPSGMAEHDSGGGSASGQGGDQGSSGHLSEGPKA